MKKLTYDKRFILGALGFLLVGCASHPGWSEYRKAMKCHFQDKSEECNKHYEKAIKHDKELPGIYASYGSHLYKNGNTSKAQELFKTEINKHPEVEQALRIVMDKSQPVPASPSGVDNLDEASSEDDPVESPVEMEDKEIRE